MMTMKEACEYVKNKRSANLAIHASKVAIDGYCKPFNMKEAKQVKVSQKSTYMKGKNHSHRALWNHKNLSKTELAKLY
jgi:uncharacterized heparinase superfamily protein